MKVAVDITGKFTPNMVDSRMKVSMEVVTYLAETQQYMKRVSDAEGTIIDVIFLNNEIRDAIDDNYYDYIAYWTDKRFGKYEGTEPTGKAPLVSFSFDDCFDYNYDTWQLFAAKGSGRGTFFMNADFIGKTMNGNTYITWSEVAEMYADGCDFQCHAFTHGGRYYQATLGINEYD